MEAKPAKEEPSQEEEEEDPLYTGLETDEEMIVKSDVEEWLNPEVSVAESCVFTMNHPPLKRRKVMLTLEEKLEIIEMMESGRSIPHISREYDMHPGTLYYIRNNKEKIKQYQLDFGKKTSKYISRKIRQRFLDRVVAEQEDEEEKRQDEDTQEMEVKTVIEEPSQEEEEEDPLYIGPETSEEKRVKSEVEERLNPEVAVAESCVMEVKTMEKEPSQEEEDPLYIGPETVEETRVKSEVEERLNPGVSVAEGCEEDLASCSTTVDR